MTSVLIVGTDSALIEGISQSLTARGHQVFFSGNLSDSLEAVGDVRPMVVLVERGAVDETRMTLRIPLAQRGAFVVFHAEDAAPEPLPHRVQRATLAELELPLETQRLMTLIRYVESRAQTLGWDSLDDGVEIQPT
jgi:DNA-binding NtrC family response regulator